MAKKNNALRIVLIVVAVILVGAIGSGVWLIAYVSNPKNAFSELEETRKVDLVATPEPTPEPTATPEQTDEALTPEPTATLEPEMTQPDYDFEKKRVNILLLGADSSTERISAGMNFRTDTMILVTVDFDNKDVDMISIPRDSYMRINKGGKFNKINAAFTFGGGYAMVALLEDTAREGDIPVQRDIMRAGGTDAGAIHLTRTGVITGGISVPCRYIHTPAETASLSDADACVRLAAALAQRPLEQP